jgi:hypothetical protein
MVTNIKQNNNDNPHQTKPQYNNDNHQTKPQHNNDNQHPTKTAAQ